MYKSFKPSQRHNSKRKEKSWQHNLHYYTSKKIGRHNVWEIKPQNSWQDFAKRVQTKFVYLLSVHLTNKWLPRFQQKCLTQGIASVASVNLMQLLNYICIKCKYKKNSKKAVCVNRPRGWISYMQEILCGSTSYP